MFDPYEGFTTAVMPNGLTVHVAHWPDRSWSAVGFAIHSGAQVDSIGIEGTAHFVEHLVSRNGSTSYEDVGKFFDRVGGSVKRGSTGYFSTKYSFFVPNETDALKKAFSIFGEMFFGLKIEKFIEEQRRVILSEFHRSFPTPVYRDLDWRDQQTLFAGTWLTRFISPLGDPDSINRITQGDLDQYYNKHYTPTNTSVVYVGGLTVDEVVEYLSSSPFGLEKFGMRNPLLQKMTYFSPPLENRYVFEKHKHIKTEVPSETSSFKSSAVIPGVVDWPAISVVQEMIQKVLFDEVREKRGWTYAVSLSREGYQAFREVSLSCTGIPHEAVCSIESLIFSLIQSIPERQELFNEIIHKMISNIGRLDMTGRNLSSSVMNEVSNTHTFTTHAEDILKIKSVTMDDIREVLKWLVPSRSGSVLTVP